MILAANAFKEMISIPWKQFEEETYKATLFILLQWKNICVYVVVCL